MSDAPFVDNTDDRKSFQAFVTMLFGGAVDWRANKQGTVTTSTIEAELLSLGQAAIYTRRLLTELTVRLNEDATSLLRDNQQTIRLMTKEGGRLQTKLKHVDVHKHWLKEAYEKKLVDIQYCPTDEMIADGLTHRSEAPEVHQ